MQSSRLIILNTFIKLSFFHEVLESSLKIFLELISTLKILIEVNTFLH